MQRYALGFGYEKENITIFFIAEPDEDYLFLNLRRICRVIMKTIMPSLIIPSEVDKECIKNK